MSTPQPAKYGCLYAVGVGPGDPELLTLKALRILKQVPVICTPQADTRPDSYALRIVREFLDESRQEVLRMPFPTDDEAGASAVWKDAAVVLSKRLKQGQDVAFITEGDPMLFSTFSYVLEHVKELDPAIPVEIVPGVSSVMAAAASAGIPLVTHGQRLAVLPAVYGMDDLSEAVANFDTVVLMKVNRDLIKALTNLERLGLTGKGTYVRRASTDRERVEHDLTKLTEDDLDYFSLLIIKR